MKWLVSHNSLQLWTADGGHLAFHSLQGVPSLLPTNCSSSVSFSHLFSDCLHSVGGPSGPVFSHPTSNQTSGCPTLAHPGQVHPHTLLTAKSCCSPTQHSLWEVSPCVCATPTDGISTCSLSWASSGHTCDRLQQSRLGS